MTQSVTLRQSARAPRMLSRESLTSARAVLLYLALVDFIAHMLVAGNYGYFRDELYYIADGRHLAAGYVDQPALIGWLAALLNWLTGDNLIAIHVLPALAGACLVYVTGLMAGELGGNRFAQVLAALGTLVTIVFLATASIFSMDVLDALWWALGAYIIIRLLRRDQPRLWLLFGLVAGLGLTTKLTMLFFGFALTLALLLTPARRYFRTPWPWLGGGIAFLFVLPYLLWNAANGWPTPAFWVNYGGHSGGGPIGFLGNQLFAMNPLTLPLTLCGLYFYLRSADGKPYRALGWTYVILYVVFTLFDAKSYFLAPAYPMLYAAGALVITRTAARPRRAWIRPVYTATLALSGLLFAPLAMPVLPPATFASTYSVLTGVGNNSAGQTTAGKFPQYLGDRFGWDTMVAAVSRVYNDLPPDERAHACIFTLNYGEASALNILGPQYHLPPVISGHNNYFLWGPGSCDGTVLITVGLPLDAVQYPDIRALASSYGSVVQAATITCDYCIGDENDLPVYVCTRPTFSSFARDVWPRLRHFN